MKLRYFSVYDEHGYDVIDNVLQYWDEDAEQWMDVEQYRIRYDKADDALVDPNAW